MAKETIIGRPDAPYAKAVKANGFLFVSGNVATADGTIEGQTQQVLETLQDTVESLGTSFEDVVKVNVYLTDMGDFSAMNEVYKGFFPSEPPTRTTVGVRELASEEFLIEIDLMAAL
jgi:2-iminobutanoate/2-iminopropanoate deaminase